MAQPLLAVAVLNTGPHHAQECEPQSHGPPVMALVYLALAAGMLAGAANVGRFFHGFTLRAAILLFGHTRTVRMRALFGIGHSFLLPAIALARLKLAYAGGRRSTIPGMMYNSAEPLEFSGSVRTTKCLRAK